MKLLNKITATTSGIIVLLISVVSLNFLASKFNFRLDLTEDKVFSLSDGTRKIIEKLDREVTIKLYFSRSLKDIPVPVKTYATRVEELLQEYSDASKGRIRVDVVDPKPDSDDEEWAQKYGITGVKLAKGDHMFFGLVFLIGTQEIAIPYLDPRCEEFLEYDIAEALMSKMKKDPIRVGIMSSLPVIGTPSPVVGPQGVLDPTWAFVNDLRRMSQVSSVDIGSREIPADLKVLIILHPKDLSEPTLYAIDQFVMYGGRVIVAVDPMSRSDLQLSQQSAQIAGQPPKIASDLEKLLQAWDIVYDKTVMVGDPSVATQINANGQMIRYPLFMTVNEGMLSKDSVVTGKLKSVLVAEGGAVSHHADASTRFQPLITLGKDSGTVNAAAALFTNPLDLARTLKVDGSERFVAASVTGRFRSAFAGGPPAGVTSVNSRQCS